jgi:hypothetical protein
MTKDSGLRIRVQRDLRDSFVEVCRAQDKPAAQVIREFMHAYVARHGAPSANTDGEKIGPHAASPRPRRKAG